MGALYTWHLIHILTKHFEDELRSNLANHFWRWSVTHCDCTERKCKSKYTPNPRIISCCVVVFVIFDLLQPLADGKRIKWCSLLPEMFLQRRSVIRYWARCGHLRCTLIPVVNACGQAPSNCNSDYKKHIFIPGVKGWGEGRLDHPAQSAATTTQFPTSRRLSIEERTINSVTIAPNTLPKCMDQLSDVRIKNKMKK